MRINSKFKYAQHKIITDLKLHGDQIQIFNHWINDNFIECGQQYSISHQLIQYANGEEKELRRHYRKRVAYSLGEAISDRAGCESLMDDGRNEIVITEVVVFKGKN